MPNYGVIDLGSNSVRLCVYEVKDDGKTAYVKKDFRSLLNNKVMAGLSAHVENEIFTRPGINRAVDVLRGHNKRLKYFDCTRVEVFATAVLRNCVNSQQVIREIEEATGFSINLLAEEEEAHLGFVGAASGTELTRGTLIDIGGGSTDLTRVDQGKDSSPVSIPQGSLSSYARHVKGILPTDKELGAITKSFVKKLQRLQNHDDYHCKTFYGIGGSVRAAAKLYAELFSTEERPNILTRTQLKLMIDACRNDPNFFAHTALKAAPERIHTIVPGCLIAASLMDEFEGESLVLCSNGLREGYLIERMLLA